MRPAENECIMRKFMVAFGRFLEVSQSCKMLQLGVQRCGSVSPVCRYVKLYLVERFYTNVMNLLRQSLLASRLSEKWPLLCQKRTILQIFCSISTKQFCFESFRRHVYGSRTSLFRLSFTTSTKCICFTKVGISFLPNRSDKPKIIEIHLM